MNKKVVILGILAVCLSISIGIGFSYAVWTQTEKQTGTNTFESGCFSISLGNENEAINIPNGYPISDEKGIQQEAYTFTITNTCSIYAHFSVNLEKLNTSTMEDQYIKLQLNNRRPMLYNAYNQVTAATTGNTSRSLDFGGLEPQATREYTLRLWIDNEATNDQVGGSTFQGNIVVTSVAAEPTGAEYIENLLATNKDTMANDDPDENVRYIGANPNNYVKFNNELWRIIGVFYVKPSEEGPYEKRIKIIRKDRLPSNLAWESSNGNDWSMASLQKVLNGDYYGKIENYSSNGLNLQAQGMVTNVVWTLGGLGEEYPSKGTAQYFYEKERENLVYDGNSKIFAEKVGLMYPSDYGYATGGSSLTPRIICLAKEMYHWDNLSDCHNNNWLFSPSYDQWTLSHYSDDSLFVFYVHSSGHVVAGWGTNSSRWVHPVVYLKSDVKITGGKGTSEQPYTLSVDD